MQRTNKIVKLHNNNSLFLSYHETNGFYLPYSAEEHIDRRMIHMSMHGPFDKWLLEKYTTNKVKILPTDTVIDCGSFVGAFAIAAFKHNVKKIYCIEPSSKNYNCLKLNIQHYGASDIIMPFNCGLGDRDAELHLNLSHHGCEDSFLKCDAGGTGKTELISVLTLDTFIKTHNIDPNNLYLKIEAEGFELEIIRGLTQFKPRVIVVDVGPERNNLSPKEDISDLLAERGYHITNTSFADGTPRCLFACM